MSPKLSRSLVSLAVFFIAAAALPQCDYAFRYSGESRASVFDLALDHNDLWTASGYGVQLYDASVDPPRLVATAAIPGITTIVRASSNTAFAGGTGGITVVRHVGNTLPIVQSVPLAGLNDLAFTPTMLYAATANGLVAFNVSDMSPSPATFPTSSPTVSSLAISGSTLYAADGDNTIEVFSIPSGASPQKLGTVTSALRVTSVEATASRLYASDGIRTEVFSGSGVSLTSLATLPYPVRSLADLGSNVVMIAGSDRELRIVDATIPQNAVELFEDTLPPSAGTVNRVTAMQTNAGHVYVGGGDIGLTTYDISHFAPPYPLRAYAIGPTGSIAGTPPAFYASMAAGGIQEMKRNSAGGLTLARLWDATEQATVQDASSDGFLLSSAGSKLTFWTLLSTTPSTIATVTFAAPIRTALLNGTASAVVLLQDGTLWTADLSQQTPSPVRVASAYSMLTRLAHSDAGTAATDVSSDGTATTVHFWPGTDLNAAPADVRVPGAATALALGGSTAAIFTFRGITTIDFTTSLQSLIPGSNNAITTALAISGSKVVAVTQSGAIRIWDPASGTLQNEYTVPGAVADLAALQNSTAIGVATSSGVATIDYGVSSSLPAIAGSTAGNRYYKKAVAGGSHLYLFDGRIIDIYNLDGTAPSWSGAVLAPGTIDIAASEDALFTLSNTEVVTEYSPAGVQLRSQPLNEGSDVTPSAIAVAANAPWVSFSKGCTTTGCVQQTDVLDPNSLVTTASLPGRTIAVATAGSRAFAIFDLPSEIRGYDVTDPLHPSLSGTTPNDIGAVAIADDTTTGTLYALADKVYGFSDRTLVAAGSHLASLKPASSAGLLVDAGCATIAGRSPAAEPYALPSWDPRSTMEVPGNIRSMLFAAGRLIILTDYSIEIWSRAQLPAPVKRRATR